VFTVGKDGMTAIEIAPHVTREEISSKTEASLRFADNLVQH
jgi:acyl CoA:acetate/3-ketoacid CoA transferase beta subunit